MTSAVTIESVDDAHSLCKDMEHLYIQTVYNAEIEKNFFYCLISLAGHIRGLKNKSHKKEMKQNILSSLSIGFLHGLAGVAHFILLLPVLAFETKLEGVQYIIGFAIGTVLAMTAYAFILGNIARYSKKANDPIFFKGIRFAGGLFAIVIGIYWLYLTF